MSRRPLSAERKKEKTVFTVWAPEKKSMQLHLVKPKQEKIEMVRDKEGYWQIEIENLSTDTQYFFIPEGENDTPDPASQFQPEGVHGPSQVIDHSSYLWEDNDWKNIPLEEFVLYELHVGTFTPEGNFEAIIPRLDELKSLGINALELMPVSQFPGNRNWGYDGVYPYAVQNSYGGPNGLKKLVDACHQKGIAVILDVVYNHLGPEGNYFSRFGPYFTNKYCTPWGDAINFDGDWSDGVRDYFSDNALYWFEEYHIDGLRCDAIHMVFDNGAINFWELTRNKVKELEQHTARPYYLIAESDLNSPKVVKPPENGGYGFNAQWLDDFHHALYVLLDEKGKDRYYDFGKLEQLAKAYTEGFVHSGDWVAFRKRKYGTSSAGVSGDKFVVFNLNHDQVGNRVGGERLCMLVDLERVKLAAAAIMLSPYIPMLFMGEEYADKTPFYYFVSHSDEALIKAVQEGRKNEFKDFGFDVAPPDPQSEKTFVDSKIQWEKRSSAEHAIVWEWHKKLIELRRTLSALKNFDKKDVQVELIGGEGFALIRKSKEEAENLVCVFNLSEQEIAYSFSSFAQKGEKILDSKAVEWIKHTDQQPHLAPDLVQAGQTIFLPALSVAVYLFT